MQFSQSVTAFNSHILYFRSDLLLGKNALLFTYGITNSGKTHTMEGSEKQPGIIKRLLSVVFNSIKDYQADPFVMRPNKSNGIDIIV